MLTLVRKHDPQSQNRKHVLISVIKACFCDYLLDFLIMTTAMAEQPMTDTVIMIIITGAILS